MKSTNNIVKFPSNLESKKKKYEKIRDKVENILSECAYDQRDLWAVAMAAGRFSSIFLSKIEGEEQAMKFFKNCMETQKSFEESRNPSNIS